MKKIIPFLAFTLLVLSTSAQVQRKAQVNIDSGNTAVKDKKSGKNELDKKEGIQNSFKRLNLTFEQKRKMREMQLVHKSGKEAIMNDKALSEDQKKEKLKEIQKERFNNLKSILSDEQIEKLKALRRERQISNKDMDQ